MNHRIRAIIIDSGRLALIKRNRADEEYYVLPGGGIEPGEEPLQALQREVFEELGVTIHVGEFFTELRRSGPDEEEMQSFYLCTQTGGRFGTGKGPEFDPDSAHAQKGIYIPIKISISEIGTLTIYPPGIKELILEKLAARS